MLKVECESCKAPYQIDERRVPAAGLKMRCPKCGHSFVVKNPASPGAGAGAPAPEAPKPPGPPPAPRIAPRAAPPPAPPMAPPKAPPMIGKPSLPSALATSDLDLPAVAGDLPAPAVARPQAPAIQKRTMMGVAGPATMPQGGAPRIVKAAPVPPPFTPPPPKDELNIDLGFGGPDPLGGDFSDLPSPAADLPAAARGGAKPPGRAPVHNKTMAFGQPGSPPMPAFPEIGFGDADLPSAVTADLPSAVTADLPMAANPNVGLPSAVNVGLPSAAAQAALKRQTVTHGFGEIDLPVAANDLPSVASALPSVASALPSVASALPSVAQSLPSVAQSLPSVAQSLPAVAQSLPTAIKTATGPSAMGSLPPAFGGGGDDFGELELPRANANANPVSLSPSSSPFDSGAPPDQEVPSFMPNEPPPPRRAAPVTSLFDENPFSSVAPPQGGGDGGFGELELPVPPPDNRGGSFADPIPQSERGSVGGMAFGELDLGGGISGAPGGMPGGTADNPFGEASLGSVIQPPPNAPMEVSRVSALGNMTDDSRMSGGEGFAPAEAMLDGGGRSKPREQRGASLPRGPSPIPKILGILAIVLLVGGSALSFTQFGPFGYYFVTDAMHAAEYAKLADNAILTMHTGLASDNFATAKATSDQLAAARAAKPRARALTAVAAIAELETELRFGKDPDRANRAKLWLTTEIPEPRTPAKVKYLDVALAAVAAIDREKDKARSGFDAATRKYGNDPIQQDIAFMRGQLELRSGDYAAATVAFKKALELAPGARAHFDLAKAAYLGGDLKSAGKELDATIAAEPKHGAALLIRAQMAWSQGRDDAAAESALKDLTTLLEGPAKSSISTGDQSQAYAERGAIQFARGRSAEARKAFEDALKVDSRNVSALIGQGDVLFEEGRLTEAITRYDTAKQADANSIPAIVGDAKTQIALERIADAKTQLADAVKRFPKSPLAMQWLAFSEQSLGNKKDAEKDYLAAIDLVDPKDPDAIEPYAAYAKFLGSQGRGDEAQAKLVEALKRLPDSVGLERTVGDVAMAQSNFAEAIARYRAALAMDAKDVSSRFRLGQALSKMNKTDEAAKVFDEVFAADPVYPSLSLERGVLYEQAGDVPKALEQFKSALEKHPNDPDLMLRVGAAYVAIGQGEKAEPLLKEVQKQRSNSAEAEHYLGRALMLEGPIHQQEAMRHLQFAAAHDTNRAEYHLYVGWLANQEVPPELGLARKEIEKALALDQTLADAYWQRGSNEYLLGQNDSAVRDLQRALQLKPTRFEAHATLALVYHEKNMDDAALSEWRLAVAHDDDNEFWNWKFGGLLLERGEYAEAAKRLKAASESGEQDQPRPTWLKGAELKAAQALQRVNDAKSSCDHYTWFLQLSDENDPDRKDARRACRDVCGKTCDTDR